MNRTSIVTTAEPAVEPVLLADAKLWLRIDDSADDAVITTLLTAARQKLENDTGLRLITQTVEVSLDRVPRCGEALQFNVGPAQSITKIETFDDEDGAVEMSAADYLLDSSRNAGRVVLAGGVSWPTQERPHTAITVTAVVGYGASGTNVPEALKLAIKLLVGEWLECGEQAESASVQRAYEALIFPYRLEWIS